MTEQFQSVLHTCFDKKLLLMKCEFATIVNLQITHKSVNFMNIINFGTLAQPLHVIFLYSRIVSNVLA